MPRLAPTPTAHKAGSRGYRRVTAALYGAGLASFAAMYCTQALLPALSTYYRITPATAALTVSLTTGMLALCDHSGERAVRALRTHHRDADVRRAVQHYRVAVAVQSHARRPARRTRTARHRAGRDTRGSDGVSGRGSARLFARLGDGPIRRRDHDRWPGRADRPVPDRRCQQLAGRTVGVLADDAGRHGGLRRAGAPVSVLHPEDGERPGHPA